MKQTILITGATSGFGQARAELFAARGWRLIVRGRREGRLRELRARLSGAEILTFRVNVHEPQTELPACDG